MTRKHGRAVAPPADHALYSFTSEFFRLFGATVHEPDPRGKERLAVRLTPELAAHFDANSLSLCFHNRELTVGEELVAHGSRVFDRMLSWLERRSAFTVQQLPKRHTSGETLMTAVKPVNASIGQLRMQEQNRYLFAFTWRITYRADDKRQELHTVLIDDEGRRLPLREETPAANDAVDLAQLLADAEPMPPEMNPDGQLLPPKLPPVTQLVHLAETARKYAIYHADLRCVGHEAEILPRLYKTLNRLTTYYQMQIEEIYDTHDPTGERRRMLEDDLQRKIAEEVENHRLRVQVELISYVALAIPTAVATITLTDGQFHTDIEVVQDRYRGTLRRPACHACGQQTATVALDLHGHVTCDDCIRQCATCQGIVCAQCGVVPCPVCGRANCDGCGQMCWACGERACSEHIGACPVCGDNVCHACQTECAVCGVRQCRSHLRLDCVAGPDGEPELICASCAIRCPGCQQYTAHAGLCSASGQRFCANCLVTCASCGRAVGPGFYLVSPVDRRSYCQQCAVECPACHEIAPSLASCAVCGTEGCANCVPRCTCCERAVCAAHGIKLESCGHTVCNRDIEVCAIGQELVCPTCRQPCAICDRLYCDTHLRVCAQCGQEYCRECVRASGLCDTCATVAKSGAPATIAQQPWAKHTAVAQLAPYYRWVCSSNLRFDIYFGEGSMMSGAVVVVERSEEGERVVHTRRVTAIERVRGMLGL
ncbi:MAG: hypothetical protein H3C34_18675 [Caldilineaceae bacterium]|nr:hypothetical protein [Caldilineaceae bacterium]